MAASSDPHALEVLERWGKADKALSDYRRQYWLNTSFYHGDQWVWWDKNNSVLRSISEGELATERVRTTINKIKPRINSLMGRMLQRDLPFEVEKSASDDATEHAAKIAEYVLEQQRRDFGWEHVREETLYNALMGGTSAVLIEWDGRNGEPLFFDPQTNTTISTGEARLSPLSIAEFTIETGSRRAEDARWAVVATLAPCEQAAEHYNLPEVPRGDASGHYSPIHRRLLTERGYTIDTELCVIYLMYERPSARKPQGEAVVVINNETVHRTPWPFPWTDKLNLRVFKQANVPMRWVGDTFMHAARPVQVAYNHIRSNMLEHSKLAANARMAVPHGSIVGTEAELTDLPGEAFEFYADGAQAPFWLAPPNMPRWIPAEAEKLEAELDDIMHTHAVSRGVSLGERASGFMVSQLAEKNDTPLGLMARDQAEGWADIGSMVLELYEANATENRTARIEPMNGVPQTIQWNGSMIRGQTKVRVPLEAVKPQSHAAMLAEMTTLRQNFPEVFAAVPQEQMVRLLDSPGRNLLEEIADPDIALAVRENFRMLAGEVEVPMPFEDHAKHIAEHNKFRNSDNYRQADPQMMAVVDDHVMAHQQLLIEEMADQQQLNAMNPGLAALPQANNPIGSQVPSPYGADEPAGDKPAA